MVDLIDIVRRAKTAIHEELSREGAGYVVMVADGTGRFVFGSNVPPDLARELALALIEEVSANEDEIQAVYEAAPSETKVPS